MEFKHLKEGNIKMALGLHTSSSVIEQAVKLYYDKNYEDLEELLRVEWQKAQDKAVLLQQMYSEVTNHNLLSGIGNDEEYDA